MLSAAAVILARLRETPPLPGSPVILSSLDPGNAGAVRACTPAVILTFAGYAPQESNASGRSVRAETTWHLTLAVDTPNTPGDVDEAMATMEPLCAAVLGRLLGFAPGPGATRLTLADPGSARPSYRGGILRLPLAVKTQVVIRAI